MRPAVTARKALADGKNIADALRIARGRAASAANTDVALAARRGAHDAMARHTQIVGYRRVPNADACVFCLVASTQRYHTGDLMPLHNNCRCAIAPIIGEIDPGQVINKDLLDSYKRGDVRDVISTHVHGELGPVLTRAGDAFAGLGAVQ